MGRKVCFISKDGQSAICINPTEDCYSCHNKPCIHHPYMAWSPKETFEARVEGKLDYISTKLTKLIELVEMIE